jgi:hypothetical protein
VRITCQYCKSDVIFERLPVKAGEYRRVLHDYCVGAGADVRVGDFGLRLRGRIAVGHSSDAFLADRVTRLSERLILKVLRTDADEMLAYNEQRVLSILRGSTQPGTELFVTLIPQPAFAGKLESSLFRPAFAAAFLLAPGFSHDLAQLPRAVPSGLDPRHIVWIWRRSLELLDWVHRSGFAHGAVLPPHIVISPREHSVRLVGWCCAAEQGAKLLAIDPQHTAYYPEGLSQTCVSREADLSMLARSMIFALGGQGTTAPPNIPAELADLLRDQALGVRPTSAAKLSQHVAEVAQRCFGPPRFVQLHL